MLLTSIKKGIKQRIFKAYWNLIGRFPYYGEEVFFPKNSFIFQRAVLEGVYERDNLAIINALVRPGTVVFDIGANIGIMSLPILNSNDVHVISVEASPNTLPYLNKTHTASKNYRRWTIIGKAVSNVEGKVHFQLSEPANGAYDSIMDTKRVKYANSTEVDCTTIDVIWRGTNSPEVSFIKIDIEGCDLLALKGGIDCIETCRPSIFLEWNSTNIIAFGLIHADLFNFFQSIKYNCFTAPALNKITSLTDLELYARFTENFLLIPA